MTYIDGRCCLAAPAEGKRHVLLTSCHFLCPVPPLPSAPAHAIPTATCSLPPAPSCPGLYYYKTPADNQWSSIDLAQLAQRAQQASDGAPKASGCSVRAWVVSEQREECAGMHGWQRACSTQPWQPCCAVAGGAGQHCLACMLSPPL